MAPPPKHISNKPLPDFVYALPPNMEPQPALTRYWCRASITRLTTVSKKAPNGTIESFIEVLSRPEGYAVRKNNFGVCNGCSEAKEGGCIEVEPHFRRAVNVLDWSIDRALRKHKDAMEHNPDGLSEEEILAGSGRRPGTQIAFQTAFDYAKACRTGFVEYDAVVQRKIRDSGLSEVKYHKARQLSREHNLERYNAAIGTVGQKAPTNVVIDERMESHFQKGGNAADAERRWYYYGTDIPSAVEAPAASFQRLSLSGSPQKRPRPSSPPVSPRRGGSVNPDVMGGDE